MAAPTLSESVTVKERPILFSGRMVRAILAGRKTQTRRVVKPQPELVPLLHGRKQGSYWWPSNRAQSMVDMIDMSGLSPFGTVGDRLWVRETFGFVDAMSTNLLDGVLYKADDNGSRNKTMKGYWKPSIHMPRWASRITLEITGIRVERVQEISEQDAIAEGCLKLKASGRITDVDGGQYGGRVWPTARAWYRDLWSAINGQDSWNANPWVWVVEFRKVT